MDKAVTWMMYSKLLTAWFAAAALLSPAAASKQTPHSTTAVSEEPFRSFRTLDAKLTLLTNQQDALKAASSLTGLDSGAAQPLNRDGLVKSNSQQSRHGKSPVAASSATMSLHQVAAAVAVPLVCTVALDLPACSAV
jgi:hypothetical protein